MKLLAAALIEAQKEMPAVKPNATNPHFHSHFVTLDHLLAQVVPVLNKHGIAVTQVPSTDEDGKPALTTMLLHSSGESLTSTMPLLVGKNDMQGLGGAITYGRRYALAAALGISSEEDDDGNHVSASRSEPVAAAVQQAQAAQQEHAPAGTDSLVFRFPSGKHQGKTLDEAPADYLDWYLNNGPRDDVKTAIHSFRGDAMVDEFAATLGATVVDDDIPFAPTMDGGF
jgi:hypothetical protein